MLLREEPPVSAAHEPHPITEADVAAFTERLVAWARDLPANEAAVLTLLIEGMRASAAADTTGHAYFPPAKTPIGFGFGMEHSDPADATVTYLATLDAVGHTLSHVITRTPNRLIYSPPEPRGW
jgi:hypothetical protein